MAETNIQFVGFAKAVIKATSYGALAELYLADSVPPVVPPPTSTVPVEPLGVDRATQFFTSSRGIQGETFSVEALTVKAGEPLWFDFQVHNVTMNLVPYRILTAVALEGPSAASWTNQDLHPANDANGNPSDASRLGARDKIVLVTPGTYRLYLGIGHDGLVPEDYRQGRLPWEPLSSAVIVTVVP